MTMIRMPKNRCKQVLVATLWLAISMTVIAQDDVKTSKNPVQTERSGMLAVGHTSILDTYLSQETFQGTEIRYTAQSLRQRTNSKISRESSHHLLLSSAGTRGNNKSLLTAMYNFKIGWYHGWELEGYDINVRIGGLADGTLGGSYNTRNSNNPAQARISLSVNPAIRTMWKFHVWKYPFKLNYEVSMPLIGLAFSPNYGQSYYEIFSEGNYDHNIVVVTPFKAPQLYQRLTLDFKLWRTTLSFGYMGDLRQMEANSLKYHQYTHAIVLGWKY